MKKVICILCLSLLFVVSCQTKAENIATKFDKTTDEKPIPRTKTSTPSKSNKDDINQNVGVVDVNKEEQVCFRTMNKNLQDNLPILIIASPFFESQKMFSAKIEKKLEVSCVNGDLDAGDRNPDDLAYYSLKLDDEKIDKFDLLSSIGVINPSKEARKEKNFIVLDINDDGKDEYFRNCTSMEGLHLTIWEGKPLKGKRIWHYYYYLGYDTEPTCKDKDYEETED